MASVWQLTLVVFPRRTLFLGVVLDRTTSTSKGTSSYIKSALSIIRSYFKKPDGGMKLTISMGDQRLTTKTDRSGSFLLEIDQPYDESQKLEIHAKGRPVFCEESNMNVYFMRETGTLVISDIDDTILVSNTNKKLKRIVTTLFRPYTRRKPVHETSVIFEALGGNQNDHVYVSRSEYNLFPMLSNFIKHNELPRGPLMLTPFLSLKELIQNNKDPEFKIKTIHLLLEHSSHEKVVLIGDDTQHDLHVYAEIAKVHGSRIKRIFIRQTDSEIDKRQSSAWSQLGDRIDNMVYYNHQTELKSMNL